MAIKIPDPDRVFRKAEGAAPERPAVGPKEGSAKARKTAARLAAVQVLYQMRMNGQDAKAALHDFVDRRVGFNLDGDVFVPADRDLLGDIVNGVSERFMDIEEIVTGALAAGKKSNLDQIVEDILRCGVYELLAHGETDTGVIINDYLSVTDGFYEGGETKLVNGILDKIAKTVRG